MAPGQFGLELQLAVAERHEPVASVQRCRRRLLQALARLGVVGPTLLKIGDEGLDELSVEGVAVRLGDARLEAPKVREG